MVQATAQSPIVFFALVIIVCTAFDHEYATAVTFNSSNSGNEGTRATDPLVQSRSATAAGLNTWQQHPQVYCPGDIIQAVTQGNVYQLVHNISQGLDNNTDSTLVAQGVAFAEASSGTLDGQNAMAVAYAAALCEDGETAEAFSQAFVVAVFCEEATGCLVLSTARAIAEANCSSIGGQVTSYANATTYATAALLGHCKTAVPSCRKALRSFKMPRGMRPSQTRALLRRYLPQGMTPPNTDTCKNRSVCLPPGLP